MSTPARDEKPETKKPAEAEKKPETAEKLDFAELDLSVERVEERISPSETNVFDK